MPGFGALASDPNDDLLGVSYDPATGMPFPKGGRDQYDPNAKAYVGPVLDKQARSLTRYVETPGAVMAPNPYPTGSEAADWYNDQRQGAVADFATKTGLRELAPPGLSYLPRTAIKTGLGVRQSLLSRGPASDLAINRPDPSTDIPGGVAEPGGAVSDQPGSTAPAAVARTSVGPNGVDWSRYNQPTGAITPPAPPSMLHRIHEAISPTPAGGARLATGLVPGSGIADVMGYLPDYEGGTYPSFGQNVKAGRYGQAALQGLGLAGDIAYAAGAVPLGAAAHEISAAGKPAAEATKGAREAFDDFVRTLGAEPHGETGQPKAAIPAEQPAGVAAELGSGEPGRAGGGDPRLEAALAQADAAAGRYDPLPGLPRKALEVGNGELFAPGPIEKVKDVKAAYMRDKIAPSYHTPPDRYHPIDEEHSKAIAKAYEDMPHAPDDPAVKNSYDAMIKETRDQYDAIRRYHPELQLIPNKPGENPYAATPRLAAKDVIENNRLHFFPTDQGFGTSAQGGIDMSTHPMMQPSGRTLDGKPLLNNDLFRIVHDYFGHFGEGYGFRGAGEDNAWRAHASMYSDLARPAMTTETRGQNSWVNYGPYGDTNRTASEANTKFADQKVGLMPEWTMRDRGSAEPITTYRGGPHAHPMVDMSYIGSGEGSGVRGEGMYSAEAPPIATFYRHFTAALKDPLLKKYGIEGADAEDVARQLGWAGGDHRPLVEDLRDRIANLSAAIEQGDTTAATRNQLARTQKMAQYVQDPRRAQGHMYQLAIDKPPEQFMHWDKPLSEQSDYVKQRVQPIVDRIVDRMDPAKAAQKVQELTQQLNNLPANASPAQRGPLQRRIKALQQKQSSNFDPNKMTGEQIYEHAAEHQLGRAPTNKTEGYPISAQYLRAKGIAGIKYLAGKNFNLPPGVPEGSHNYVNFFPERILKRYAIPGMLGGAVALPAFQRRNQDGT